jgi:hypothetical protein
MLKLKKIVVAVALALPMAAGAQTNEELNSEIQQLKAQVNELRDMMKQQAAAPAPSPTTEPAAATVDPSEFSQLQVKVDAIEDSAEVAGMKGLRISAGFDPVYMYNQAKGTSSFAFLNNFSNINGSGEVASYDNSYFGMAYLDIQKDMGDGGTKLRLTLAPSKSAGSGYNFGNIVHEASASIPFDGLDNKFIVGQMPDVSGYEPYVNTYSGINNVTSNQLYPGYAEYFITKNLLFDFTEMTYYTGAGVDLTRDGGNWEYKFILANANSARNDCTSLGTCSAGLNKSPMLIYNVTYAEQEFWGYEFTGYEGSISNFNGLAPVGASTHLDQIETDAWFTRGDFNANVQYTLGRQRDAALNADAAGNPQDAKWWGISTLVSERVTPKLTLAGRIDYLNNSANGGGTFDVGNANSGSATTALNGVTGDAINGFGAGDPNAAGYNPNIGANRYDLTFAATYRLTPFVAFRGEVRHDIATTSSFYYFNDGSFHKTNNTVGLQTIVNF